MVKILEYVLSLAKKDSLKIKEREGIICNVISFFKRQEC